MYHCHVVRIYVYTVHGRRSFDICSTCTAPLFENWAWSTLKDLYIYREQVSFMHLRSQFRSESFPSVYVLILFLQWISIAGIVAPEAKKFVTVIKSKVRIGNILFYLRYIFLCKKELKVLTFKYLSISEDIVFRCYVIKIMWWHWV